jgi:cobalt-zinc-cadmium efflux system outer membrane protein
MKFFIQIMLLIFISGLGFATRSYAATDLSMFINDVIENNPAIQAAKSNVLAARARENASGQSLYNPEVSIQRQNAIENTAMVEISQSFDWANKKGARRGVGTANVWVAQAELDNLRQQLSTNILSALAKYLAEQKTVALAKERTALFQQFINISKKRYTSGDIARVDLDLANLALSEAMAQQADAEVNMNLALQSLRAITGFNQMTWPGLSNAMPVLSDRNIDSEHLITHLPAFLVLSRKYQSALAQIKVAERNRIPDPTIGIQGGKQWEGSETKKLVGITVGIPLFVSNPYRAEVDAANFDAMEADAKRNDLVRQVRAEIKSSAERYQTLYQAVQQWQQISGKPLSNGTTLTERLWQAGEITTTDYVVQIKQRIDSQIAGVQLKSRAWQAWAEWLKASGQVDTWLQIHPNSPGD